jgi:hypothetical protein
MATDMFGNVLSPEEEERLRLHQIRMGIEPAPVGTPSLYPNQAAPYGSFPMTTPTTPSIWESPLGVVPSDPQVAFGAFPRPTSDYTPKQLSTPIKDLQQQNIPQNVLPITPTGDVNLAGMSFGGVVPAITEAIAGDMPAHIDRSGVIERLAQGSSPALTAEEADQWKGWDLQQEIMNNARFPAVGAGLVQGLPVAQTLDQIYDSGLSWDAIKSGWKAGMDNLTPNVPERFEAFNRLLQDDAMTNLGAGYLDTAASDINAQVDTFADFGYPSADPTGGLVATDSTGGFMQNILGAIIPTAEARLASNPREVFAPETPSVAATPQFRPSDFDDIFTSQEVSPVDTMAVKQAIADDSSIGRVMADVIAREADRAAALGLGLTAGAVAAGEGVQPGEPDYGMGDAPDKFEIGHPGMKTTTPDYLDPVVTIADILTPPSPYGKIDLEKIQADQNVDSRIRAISALPDFATADQAVADAQAARYMEAVDESTQAMMMAGGESGGGWGLNVDPIAKSVMATYGTPMDYQVPSDLTGSITEPVRPTVDYSLPPELPTRVTPTEMSFPVAAPVVAPVAAPAAQPVGLSPIDLTRMANRLSMLQGSDRADPSEIAALRTALGGGQSGPRGQVGRGEGGFQRGLETGTGAYGFDPNY